MTLLKKSALILLPILAAGACIVASGKRDPQLSKPPVIPAFADQPAIELVVGRTSATDAEFPTKKFNRSLERVRKRFSFLPTSDLKLEDPDYRILLQVSYSTTFDEPKGIYYWLWIPFVTTDTVSAKATIKTRYGGTIGVVSSTGTTKAFWWILALPVGVLATPTNIHLDKKLWDNTLRDVFIQAGQAIEEEMRQTAPHSDGRGWNSR
jgi:hypothetical protein